MAEAERIEIDLIHKTSATIELTILAIKRIEKSAASNFS